MESIHIEAERVMKASYQTLQYSDILAEAARERVVFYNIINNLSRRYGYIFPVEFLIMYLDIKPLSG